MGLGLENLADAVFDVKEEVVDEPLNVRLGMRCGERA